MSLLMESLLLSQAEEVEAEIDLYHDMDKNQLLEVVERMATVCHCNLSLSWGL